MELTANYGLVLPKNYVSIDSTEMEYVDGGWKNFTNSTWFVGGLIDVGLAALGINICAISCLLSYAFVQKLGQVCAKIGSRLASMIFSAISTGVTTLIGKLGMGFSFLMSCSSLGGAITCIVDMMDGNYNGYLFA